MSKWHWNPEWRAARKLALNRDGYRCRDCGKAGMLEVHHIQSLSKGGDNELTNLRTMCRSCHIALHRPKPIIKTEWDFMVEELLHGNA